ncbi:MAG: class IV adenylate cyclase [Candidatus Sericytochromatia bacterium]
MEIELKVFSVDPLTLRTRLQAAGAETEGREFQANHMYDYPDHRLYEQQDGSYIRLRRRRWLDREAEEVRLTFKRTVSRDRYKIADETETKVGDFETMARFLTQLGLVETRVDEKLRETWRLDGIHFEIDEWAGLPPYLEVEAESEAEVARGLSLLGYSLEDTSAENLREVLARYNIQARSLRFADFGRQID